MNKNNFSNIILKYKKYHKNKKKILGFSKKCICPFLGIYGIKALEGSLLNKSNIEACRKVIVRKIKKQGNLYVNCTPNIPVTTKSIGLRMGKGKGPVSSWVFPVKTGRILIEIKNVARSLAINALKSGSKKLPLLTKIVEYKL